MRYTHFGKTERLELSVLLKKGYSLRDIASALKRSPSSVSREIKKNSVSGVYDPHKANHKARVRRKHSKYQAMKVRERTWLEADIRNGLEQGWTPEEITGRLRAQHGHSVVSFKTIYKYLYTVYGIPWCQYLPSRRSQRRKRRRKKTKRVLIPHRRFIDQRPQIVEERVRIGDFEGDTLGVPKSTHHTLAAVVDRASLYFLATKISRVKYAVGGYQRLLKPLLVQSLTLDNGVEHVRYEQLDVDTYFAHPYRSWEKPLIENTFQRLRRYIPKKARLADYSDTDISDIVDRMNGTPRKRLGYQTPEEVFKNYPLPSVRCECCT